MTDALMYTYPSPLEGFRGASPLSEELSEDGNSYKSHTPEKPSLAYTQFTGGIVNSARGGFDIHVYYQQRDEYERNFAKELCERVRREFPELRVHRLYETPVGPHTTAMFEVNVFTPQQFGAFIPWLVIHRGPLSTLIHPNTDDEYRDHTQRSIFMGPAVPLYLRMFKHIGQKKQEENSKT
ncbi:hypothetical protein ANO11243_045970 [Dothideomycetidae sp. 11243]|nr:hypothetical protein ANO11243_045970 [fungal sp. No.11243]